MASNIDNIITNDPTADLLDLTLNPDDGYGLSSPSMDGANDSASTQALKNMATSNTLDWELLLKNMGNNRYSNTSTIPNGPSSIANNSYVLKEKQRLSSQNTSQEKNRSDFFSIGTVYLNIPPAQISISEEKHNFRYKVLRSAADIVTTSGRSTMRIDLEIYFNGLDDINNKLRPLIAQFKCTPFLPIENAYVRDVLEPDLSGIFGELAEEEQDLEKLKQIKDKVDSMTSNIQEQKDSATQIMAKINGLVKDGTITSAQGGRINTVLSGYYLTNNKVPFFSDQDAQNANHQTSIPGQFLFNPIEYINSVVGVPQTVYNGIAPYTQTLRDIGSLSQNIIDKQNAINQIYFKDMDSRLKNRRMVGVLSQMTVSTMPGYPETLACRLSMYKFNYDPYMYEFGFIKGYDKTQFTPDITECDLFVDWYSNRFLKEDNSLGSLSPYIIDNGLKFEYIKDMTYEALATNKFPTINKDVYNVTDGIIATGISVTMRNVIQFLPLLSGDSPTCQYMGAYNSSVSINLSCTNQKKLKSLRSMISQISKVSRINNKLGRFIFFAIDNPLVALFGTRFFVLESNSIDTVPGNPGLTTINLEATEIKLDTENAEQLDRITLNGNNNIMDAMDYIFDKAVAYLQDTSKDRVNTLQYKQYYEVIFGDDPQHPENSPLYHFVISDINQDNGSGGTAIESDPARRADVKRVVGTTSQIGYQAGNIINAANSLAYNVGYNAANWLAYPVVVPGGAQVPDLNAAINKYAHDYVLELSSAMQGDWSGMNLATEKEYIKKLFVRQDGNAIKSMLTPDAPSDFLDLRDFVYGRALAMVGSPKNLIDPSCYPDLGLPLYRDLGDAGKRLKLTYGDIGMLETTPGMRSQPAQLDWVTIEPDAFFWSNSILKLVDNTGTQGINAGMQTFETQVLYNQYSEKSPIDPNALIAKLKSSLYFQDDGNYVPDSELEKEIDNFTQNFQNEQVKVVNVIDSNTVDVQAISDNGIASGPVVRVRLPYSSKKYNQASSTLSSSSPLNLFGAISNIFSPDADTNKLKSLTNGATMQLQLVPNASVVAGGQKIIAVDGTITLPNGTTQDISSAAKSSGIDMIKSLYDPSEEINDAGTKANDAWKAKMFGDWAFSTSKVVGSAVAIDQFTNPYLTPAYQNSLKYLASSALGPIPTIVPSAVSSISSILKNNNDEKTKIGVTTQKMSASTSGGVPTVETSQFNWSAQARVASSSNNIKNGTFYKFDNRAKMHLDGIVDRIKHQSKDDSLRMVKAFPTFKFYFVEEDRMDYQVPFVDLKFKAYDDVYMYDAVISIDIIKSRKEAADTAIIQLSNTKGILDRDKFGLHDSKTGNQQRDVERGQGNSVRGTAASHETLEEFVLKTGTRIKVKMGYTSDPSLLDLVFTGVVSEVNAGDVITIVAQGYGIELENKITGWGTKKKLQSYSAYKILDKLMQLPGVAHFGGKEWVSIQNISQKQFGRRLIPSTSLGPWQENGFKYLQPSFWREWAGVPYILQLLNDTRNNNIWTPEASQLQEEYHGDAMNFTVENRSIWEVFQEFTRRMPGYITSVIPFDNRATIYFGPPDGYYSYSNEVKGLLNEQKDFLEDPSAMVTNALSDQTIQELSLQDKQTLLNNANALIQQYGGQAIPTLNSGQNYTKALQLVSATLQNMNQKGLTATPGYATLNNLNTILATGGPSMKQNVSMNYSNQQLQGVTSTSYLNVFNTQDINTLANWRIFKDSSGNYVDQDTFTKQVWGQNLRVPANMKLIRSYHYKDSLKNIVANNIIATDENMWNRVEIVSKLQFDNQSNIIVPLPGQQKTVAKAALSDMLWKEAIKTKVCVEPNASTPQDAWMYALGNLKYGVNEMYSGSLTVLGDPTIKPNDVVFMNDYYTDMHGAFEVREVVHHFSHETGFVTTIVPDCICYANNAMAMATEAIAGGWYDDVANSTMWIYKLKVPFAARYWKQAAAGAIGVAGTSFLLRNGVKGGASKIASAAANTGSELVANLSRVPFLKNIFPSTEAATATTTEAAVATDAATAAAGVTGAEATTGAVAATEAAGGGISAGTLGIGALVLGGAAIVAEIRKGAEFRNKLGNMQFGLLGSWVSNLVGNGALNEKVREPLNFLPLMYGGRPFVAGIKGLHRHAWWEAALTTWNRVVYYTFNVGPRAMVDYVNTATMRSIGSYAPVQGSTGSITGSKTLAALQVANK